MSVDFWKISGFNSAGVGVTTGVGVDVSGVGVGSDMGDYVSSLHADMNDIANNTNIAHIFSSYNIAIFKKIGRNKALPIVFESKDLSQSLMITGNKQIEYYFIISIR